MWGRNNKLDTEWLGKVSFFEGFSDDELDAVASLGERVDVAAETMLIDQGRIGDACYVIVEGSAEVRMGGDFVASLGPGSMVGEMALVEHRPRSASVTAETDMVVVAFDTKDFTKLLEASPTTHTRVMTMLRRRLAENQERSR